MYNTYEWWKIINRILGVKTFKYHVIQGHTGYFTDFSKKLL